MACHWQWAVLLPYGMRHVDVMLPNDDLTPSRTCRMRWSFVPMVQLQHVTFDPSIDRLQPKTKRNGQKKNREGGREGGNKHGVYHVNKLNNKKARWGPGGVSTHTTNGL